MAFLKIDEAEVSNDDGYRIRIGHSRLTYCEHGAVVPFDAEHLANGVLAIYGFSAVSGLNSATQQRILNNVREALAFLNVKCDIQAG